MMRRRSGFGLELSQSSRMMAATMRWRTCETLGRMSLSERATIAMGLAQAPADPNWPYLMRSLHLLKGDAAVEVMAKLKEVRKAPAEPEYLRQAILCGLRTEKLGAKQASELLAFWTGAKPVAKDADWQETMKGWQDWFAKKYPNKQPAELPTTTVTSRYELEELIAFLSTEEAQRKATRSVARRCLRRPSVPNVIA